jgi:hypothetical protein
VRRWCEENVLLYEGLPHRRAPTSPSGRVSRTFRCRRSSPGATTTSWR